MNDIVKEESIEEQNSRFIGETSILTTQNDSRISKAKIKDDHLKTLEESNQIN